MFKFLWNPLATSIRKRDSILLASMQTISIKVKRIARFVIILAIRLFIFCSWHSKMLISLFFIPMWHELYSKQMYSILFFPDVMKTRDSLTPIYVLVFFSEWWYLTTVNIRRLQHLKFFSPICNRDFLWWRKTCDWPTVRLPSLIQSAKAWNHLRIENEHSIYLIEITSIIWLIKNDL